MSPKKKPLTPEEIYLGLTQLVRDTIPHYAAVFKAFAKEAGISRKEALALTAAYMQAAFGSQKAE